jgi:hypothetical protein
MSNLIKCPECKTWNENLDFCQKCNHLLNYEQKKANEDESKRLAHENREKDWLDLFWLDLENSDLFWKKSLYYLMKSVWFLILLISTGALAFLALGPG